MGTAPSIIGVSGFMRTGKDSVAKLLIDVFGYKKVSFADPLRKMALDIDPYISLENSTDRDLVEIVPPAWMKGNPRAVRFVRYSDLIKMGYERAKEVPDFRRFLQRLGTEGVRNNFGANAWVDLAVKHIQTLPEGTKVVLPDVRFPNEADAVHGLGGSVWRTERPGYEGGVHPSEAMVAQITPDVTLLADSLLDHYDQDGTEYRGLGTLVLEQLGENPDEYQDVLKDWADSILNG